MRTCETEGCNESLENYHPAKRFCPKCAAIRAATQKSAGGTTYRARKRGAAAKTCPCGAEILAKDYYCAPCKVKAEIAKEERKRAAKKKRSAEKKAILPPQGKKVRIYAARPTDEERERAEMARVGCRRLSAEEIARISGTITPIDLIPHFHYADGAIQFQ